MAALTDYKGLNVVEDATGDGGVALTDNFKELADRAPYQAASNPGVNDDSAKGFSPGDQWMNTSTQVLWSCVSNNSGAAIWKSVYKRTATGLELIPSESSESVSVMGTLNVTGSNNSYFIGNVGIGTSTPQANLHGAGSTILGIASAAVSDANIGHSQVNVWLDEANHLLKFKSKTSSGTVNTAELPVPLTMLSNVTLGISAAEKVVTANSNGFVGLEINPTYPLHVHSSTRNDVARFQSSRGTGYCAIDILGGIPSSTARVIAGLRLIDTSQGANNLRWEIRKEGNTDLSCSFFSSTGSFHQPLAIEGAISYQVKIAATGVGIGTNSPSRMLDINSGIMRLRSSNTPASSSAAGNQGDICWNSQYIDVCVATNTWKRSALESW